MCGKIQNININMCCKLIQDTFFILHILRSGCVILWYSNAMYKINRSIVFQKLDNQLACFNTDESVIYTLNDTAEFVFRKLKNGWKEEEIIAAMAKKYDVALPTLKKDVKILIKDMIKNKIICSASSK